MNKRLIGGLAAAGIVGGAVFGFAATLDVDSSRLGAGGVAVGSCDDKVNVTYEVAFASTDYEITSVTVADIAEACEASDLSVTLSGGAAPVTVVLEDTIDATSESIDVPAGLKAEDLDAIDVVINGNAVAADYVAG